MVDFSTALSKAAGVTSWAVGMCDQFVAEMWGFPASGYNTALDNWNASPGKHQGDMNAPAGALMFWGGGQGHVALSAGDGTIYSTDISGSGTVSRVPATEITAKWGKPYLGWAPPFFGGQAAGAVGQFTGTPNSSPVGGTVPAGFSPLDPGSWISGLGGLFGGDITGGFSKLIGGALKTVFGALLKAVLKWVLWVGEIVLGLAMLFFGAKFVFNAARS